MRRSVTSLVWMSARQPLLFASCLLAASCGGTDSEDPAAQPPRERAGASEWAVRLYAGPAGAQRRVDIPPTPLSTVSSTSAKPASARVLADVGTPSGSTSVDQTDTTNPLAWALLRGALLECDGPRSANSVGISLPPWRQNEQASFMFTFSEPRSCDALLVDQELAVCAAQKLADLADAVDTTTWANAEWIAEGIPGPWVIPVQSEKDRFILRDMAIYTLANAAFMDLWQVNVDGVGRICTDHYAHAARDGNWAGFNASMLFEDVGHLTPAMTVSSTADDLAKIGKYRLLYKTKVLQAGGRLLHDLIVSSIDSDLAAAHQRRARQTDPGVGARVMWNNANSADEAGDAPYGTLAHALRVLNGRWELAPSGQLGFGGPDPKCENAGAMDLLHLLPDSLGRSLSQTEMRTRGQAVATTLFESNGIIPTIQSFSEDEATLAQLRVGVEHQILLNAAVAAGEPASVVDSPTSAFMTSGQGASLTRMMGKLSNADFNYAGQDASLRYLLATSAPPIMSELNAGHAGITSAGRPQHADFAAFGISTKFGVPREDLLPHPMARFGAAQGASQCPELLGRVGAFRADFAYRWAFQDSFAVAQTFQQRLIAIRENWAVAPALSGPSSRERRNIDLGVAELDAWAGPGRIVATSYGADGVAGIVEATFLGFRPEDFSASSIATMKDEIAIVYGPPWAAECVAKLRTSCPPEDELKKYVGNIDTAFFVANDPRYYGEDGTFGYVRLYAGAPEANGPGAYFLPEYARGPSNLYAVALHDPAAPSHGKVLGSLRLRGPSTALPEALPSGWSMPDDLATASGTAASGTAVAVSNLHEKLMDQVFAVDPSGAAPGKHAMGIPGVTYPKSLCGEVPREIFVPLENELTSDSDQYENSWKHYLSLAKSSAARTDELGKELIDLGLRQDLRREEAMAAVGKACGHFPSADSVVAKDGALGIGAYTADPSIVECTHPEKADVVFLGADPTEAMSEADATTYLQTNVLRCYADKPFPGNKPSGHPRCTADKVSHGSLGLKTSTKPNEAVKDAGTCDGLVKAADSLKHNGAFDTEKVVQAANAAFISKLGPIGSQLSLEVAAGDANRWKVLLSKQVVMDSAPQPDAWPGCRRVSVQNGCAGGTKKLAERLDAVFRDTSGVLTDAESHELRWRVSGALWLLGSLGGTMPSQTLPLPAVDWTVVGDVGTTPKWFPLAAQYGALKFVSAPTGGVYAVDALDASPEHAAVPEVDREAMGPAYSLPTAWKPGRQDEVPAGLWDLLWNQSGNVKIIGATLDRSRPPAPVAAKGGWIAKTAKGFEGMRCPSLHSQPYDSDALGSTYAVAMLKARGMGKPPKPGNLEKPTGPGNGLGPEGVADIEGCNVDGDGVMLAAGADGRPTVMLVPLSAGDLPTKLWFADTFFEPITFSLEASQATDPQDLAKAVPVASISPAPGYLFDPVTPKSQSDCRFGPPQVTWEAVCRQPGVPGGAFAMLNQGCAVAPGSTKGEAFGSNVQVNNIHRLTPTMLRPTVWRPSSRVPLFANSHAPANGCIAAAQLVGCGRHPDHATRRTAT